MSGATGAVMEDAACSTSTEMMGSLDREMEVTRRYDAESKRAYFYGLNDVRGSSNRVILSVGAV